MPAPEETEEGGFTADQYQRHRLALQSAMCDQAKSFDRAILTLSSGALLLSLVFVEKVAPKPMVCWTKCFLIQAWLLFAGAIVSTLVSFVASQRAHRALIAEWDESWASDANPQRGRKSDSLDRLTAVFNIASIVSFVLGIISFIVFAIGNIGSGD